MKAYVATFRKKNGDERTMNFVQLSELPTEFLNTKISGSGNERNLDEGLELVWDIENNGFRVFNWNTVVGNPDEYVHANTKFLNVGVNKTTTTVV